MKAFAYFNHTKDDCVASTGFAVLTVRAGVDPRFVLYSLLSDAVSAQIEAHVVGSNYPAINTKDIRRLEILTAPPAQQRKIARILTTVDNLIEKTEALIAKYQAIKQGMMHDLFTRGVDEHGQLRPTYEEAPNLYKQSELGWIPNEWDSRPLQSIARVVDSLHRTPEFSQQGFAMVRVTDIKGSVLALDRCARVASHIYEDFTSSHQPQRGDIVLSRVGSYGISSYVETDESFCMGQNTVVITHHPHSRFLFEFLQTKLTKRQFDFDVAGSSQKTLSLRAIRECIVPVPSGREQESIAKRLTSISQSVSNDIRCIGRLAEVKTGLMQDLLTGRVRVKVDEEDTADVGIHLR